MVTGFFEFKKTYPGKPGLCLVREIELPYFILARPAFNFRFALQRQRFGCCFFQINNFDWFMASRIFPTLSIFMIKKSLFGIVGGTGVETRI